MAPLGPLTIRAMVSSNMVAIAPPCMTPGHPDNPPPIHTTATISLVSAFQNALCTPKPRVPLKAPNMPVLASPSWSFVESTSTSTQPFTLDLPPLPAPDIGASVCRLKLCFRRVLTMSKRSISWPRDSTMSLSSGEPGEGRPSGAANWRAPRPVVIPNARTPPYHRYDQRKRDWRGSSN
jgi:hypothetical protein